MCTPTTYSFKGTSVRMAKVLSCIIGKAGVSTTVEWCVTRKQTSKSCLQYWLFKV